MRINRKSKGFTLVELLVVIAIIGLLASVVVVSVGTARAKSRDARRIADMKAIMTAIEIYKDGSGGNAPESTGNMAVDLADLVSDGYIGAIPPDPKGGSHPAYSYSNTGGDDSYYIEFTTESGSTLGDPGAYCATTAGLRSQESGACVEY
jgi:general secretion pathway protein G